MFSEGKSEAELQTEIAERKAEWLPCRGGELATLVNCCLSKGARSKEIAEVRLRSPIAATGSGCQRFQIVMHMLHKTLHIIGQSIAMFHD